MAKIREDLDGVVRVGSLTLRADDVVPEGVRVGAHLTEDAEPVEAAPCEGCRIVEPLTEEEVEAAGEIDLPVEGLDPERVRGAILGFAEGFKAGVESLTGVAGVVSVEKISEDDVPEKDEDHEDELALETLNVDPPKPATKRGPGRPRKNA